MKYKIEWYKTVAGERWRRPYNGEAISQKVRELGYEPQERDSGFEKSPLVYVILEGDRDTIIKGRKAIEAVLRNAGVGCIPVHWRFEEVKENV